MLSTRAFSIATERIQRHIFLVSQPRYERRRRPNIRSRCASTGIVLRWQARPPTVCMWTVVGIASHHAVSVTRNSSRPRRAMRAKLSTATSTRQVFFMAQRLIRCAVMHLAGRLQSPPVATLPDVEPLVMSFWRSRRSFPNVRGQTSHTSGHPRMHNAVLVWMHCRQRHLRWKRELDSRRNRASHFHRWHRVGLVPQRVGTQRDGRDLKRTNRPLALPLITQCIRETSCFATEIVQQPQHGSRTKGCGCASCPEYGGSGESNAAARLHPNSVLGCSPTRCRKQKHTAWAHLSCFVEKRHIQHENLS